MVDMADAEAEAGVPATGPLALCDFGVTEEAPCPGGLPSWLPRGRRGVTWSCWIRGGVQTGAGEVRSGEREALVSACLWKTAELAEATGGGAAPPAAEA
mmetsp:Transcript_35483/g.109053  ORF Transcript_35483/g.109053 Transcript_35483/m.109053 type:complete len:99 (+) Transcript_35483:59-355(+)